MKRALVFLAAATVAGLAMAQAPYPGPSPTPSPSPTPAPVPSPTALDAGAFPSPYLDAGR